jgi:hypothetical protein
MIAAMTDDIVKLLGDRDAWAGGNYGLAIRLGPPNDAILQRATRALLSAAGIERLWRNAPEHPERIEGDIWTLQDLTHNRHLRGVVELPAGPQVNCGLLAIRYEGGEDWLYLYLPLAALGRIDARIGAFPFGADPEASSLAWRRPLDEWLAQLAIKVRCSVSFELALIGMEAETDEAPVMTPLQQERPVGVVMANGTYLPATY